MARPASSPTSSPTSSPAPTADLLAAIDLPTKIALLTGQDFWTLPGIPAIGLRAIRMSDGPAGVRGATLSELDPSANLPAPVAMAASWDESLVNRLGALLAVAARRKGVDVLLGPTINLQRSPFGGRHFECFAEDPLLTGRLGVAYVRGVQAGGVAATAKHYVANDAETDRFTVDVRVAERALREVYLAPFEDLVRDADVWVVMAAYNSVHGTTMTEHPLLADPLRAEWGFTGVVLSDWVATRSTVASATAELDLVMPGPAGPWGAALLDAVRAGAVSVATIDRKVGHLLGLARRVGALAEPPAVPVAEDAAPLLREAAAAGMVLLRNRDQLLPLNQAKLSRVAVLGELAAHARTQGGGSATIHPEPVTSPLAGLRAALPAECQVTHAVGTRLTDGLHPIPPGDTGFEVRWFAADNTVLRHEHRRGSRLLWLGDAEVNAVRVELSGEFRADVAGTWQFGFAGTGTFRLTLGDEEILADTLHPDPANPGAAMMTPPERSVSLHLNDSLVAPIRLSHDLTPGSPVVTLMLGATPPHPDPATELADAVAAAAAADVAIVVVGTTERCESEGFDRAELALPADQDELVRAVAKASPRTVVVVNSGAPVLLPWRDEVDAIVLAWFAGQELGNALAEVLLGVREPGGRLPHTWPADEHGVPSTTPTDGALTYAEGVHVGYRGWLRSGVEPAYPFGHGLGYTTWTYTSLAVSPTQATVTLRNTGSRPGKEVVQLYLSKEDSVVDRPVRWLAGFAVVRAEAGAEITATIEIRPRAWQHWADGQWRTEPGEFVVHAGRSVVDLPLHTTLTVAPGSPVRPIDG